MIQVTRLDHTPMIVNPDLIIFMEETPDTVITLSNGEKILVQERISEIIHRVIQFRRSIYNSAVPIE
ncbi:MAG: flagellar FlbD family protein [Deltaproteobacteria bacterium]|nr:flagellar FlbD family protein [Deltaproteobacteria bacterium]